jgi:hypothetical protein
MRYFAKAPDQLCSHSEGAPSDEGFVEVDRGQYKDALNALTDSADKRRISFSSGEFALVEPPTPEPEPAAEPEPPTQQDFAFAIQDRIDTTAISRGYQDGFALASYATSTIPQWAAEAAAFIAWRDAVWVYAHQELASVLNGSRAIPTIAGFLEELPGMKWPA